MEVFARVRQVGSVNGAARSLRLGASQVSKAVRRLERYLGAGLFARSARGVELTEHGRRLTPRPVELLTRASDLAVDVGQSELVIAAPSFLWMAVGARMVEFLHQTRVHCLETSSPTMTAHAGESLFDIALALGEEPWPPSWAKMRIGAIRRGLFATPNRARRLGARVRAEDLRGALFVGRLVSERGQLLLSHDGCPLSDRERQFGHRAQTVAMARELAQASGQLVFAPALAARPYVRRRALMEIPVQAWDVREPVHLICHQDRVSSRVQHGLAALLERKLR